jgi:hypothetical protein
VINQSWKREHSDIVDVVKEGAVMETDVRFKHNLGLEMVMRQLFGSKRYDGMAGGFADASYTRECLLRAVKRIRNRLDEIPMDERLIGNVGRILDGLEGEVKRISESANFDWFLIADLLNLIVHLVGYDRLDGKVHRSVIYSQNRGQEQEDWRWLVGDREYYDTYRLEEKRRYMLVNQLCRNKVPKYQIAKLLGLSIQRVNQILSEIPEIEKSIGRSIPSFE